MMCLYFLVSLVYLAITYCIRFIGCIINVILSFWLYVMLVSIVDLLVVLGVYHFVELRIRVLTKCNIFL